MITKIIIGFRWSLIFTAFFLFNSVFIFSQQIIKLKTGEKYIVNIKSQSHDTLIYQLPSKPKITKWVLMSEVDNIKNLKTGRSIPLADTIPDKKKEELYYQNRGLRNIGIGFVIGGAAVTGLGLALLIPAASEGKILSTSPSPEWAHNQLVSGAIVTAIGAAGMITGTIMAIVGSTNMKKYVLKQEISLDIKCTPGHMGLTLVFRF
jgi:hypothetical protein